MSGPYQHVLKRVYPYLKIINVYAEQTNSTSNKKTGVATGFSGGIDSYSVLADHYFSQVPLGFKITHLLFNNVGSHDHGLKAELLFHKRFTRLKSITDKWGLPFVQVNSNLDDFYRHSAFQYSHTLRNASVALILQNEIGRYLYATAYSFSEVKIGLLDSIDPIDPISLAYLSTESVDMHSIGGEYTRVQKTEAITKLLDTYEVLDVCVSPNEDTSNCSKCSKCIRTLTTLDITGQIHNYVKVFNLDLYKKNKSKYFGNLIENSFQHLLGKNRNIFAAEILQFALREKYKIPPKSVIFAFYFFLADLKTRVIQILKRILLFRNFRIIK